MVCHPICNWLYIFRKATARWWKIRGLVTELIGLDKAPLAKELWRNRALLARESNRNRPSFLKGLIYWGRIPRYECTIVDSRGLSIEEGIVDSWISEWVDWIRQRRCWEHLYAWFRLVYPCIKHNRLDWCSHSRRRSNFKNRISRSIGFPDRSFEWWGLRLLNWIKGLEFWGLPWNCVWYVRGLLWKLVRYFGSRNDLKSDLLRVWIALGRADAASILGLGCWILGMGWVDWMIGLH